MNRYSLSNLYNQLPQQGMARFVVFKAIVTIASQNNHAYTFLPALQNISKAVEEWGIGESDQSELYLLLSQVVEKVE